MDAVGDILAARENEPFPWAAGFAGAALLHGMIGLGLVVAGRAPRSHAFIAPHAVSVRLVPLGSIRPAEREQPPAAPAPSRPVIQKVDEPPAPSPKALPAPDRKPVKHPPAPSPRPAPGPAPALSLPSAEAWKSEGVPEGSTFGTSVSGFDSRDFNYSYYVARMLSAIGASWFKGTNEQVVAPVVNFRIARDGSVSDARIERSSGLPFVDRAAIRAVLAASPLPPLPADFTEPSLGVHLKFE